MKVKLIVVILAFSASFFVEKCDFAVVKSTPIDNQNQTHETSPVSTSCQIKTSEGYCVPIRNCLALLTILSPSDLRARKCGPSNENKKNPSVCCEKQYLEWEATGQAATTPRVYTSAVTAATSIAFPEEIVGGRLTSTTSRRTSSGDSFAEVDNQMSEPPIAASPRPPVTELPEKKNPSEQCGVQDIESRIVGGLPADRKEFPWLARLLRRDSRQGDMVFSCTGALIAPKVVLTTAHCLVSSSLVKQGELYAVALGEHETECDLDANECLRNKKTVIVSESISHPGYQTNSRNHDNDIGLIILRDEVKFTSYITPICLLEKDVMAPEYFVAGWGKTEAGDVSGVKLKTSLPPFSWEQCAKKYMEIRVELTSRQICAGGLEGVDSCQGDSGGPLMVRRGIKWYVAGVVSFGLGCGRQGWPAIYVHIPKYLDWINTTVRERA